MCLNVKRFTKGFRHRYSFPAIITLYNCSKPKWRMIENVYCKINLVLEIVCRIQTVWYRTDLVLQVVNLNLKRHNLKNKKTDLYDSVLLYFICIVHHLCQAPCCVRLHTPCCIFLRVVGSCCICLHTTANTATTPSDWLFFALNYNYKRALKGWRRHVLSF